MRAVTEVDEPRGDDRRLDIRRRPTMAETPCSTSSAIWTENPRSSEAATPTKRGGACSSVSVEVPALAEVNVAAPEFARPDGPPRAATAVD